MKRTKTDSVKTARAAIKPAGKSKGSKNMRSRISRGRNGGHGRAKGQDITAEF